MSDKKSGRPMTIYDIAVIGKGLIGSAALRHLAVSFPELKVCAIGPDEPQDRKSHQGVFASHYDQGRVTRVLDPSPIWGHLARESIKRYPTIEAESRVRFHHRAGCLRVTDLSQVITEVDACAARFQPPHQRLDADSCRSVFPFLEFSNDFVGWDERGEAGYINPRSLIEAQLAVAESNGATILREIVDTVKCESDGIDIRTREGSALHAKRALITAGGYSNTLLGAKLDLRTKAHTILLAEISPAENERLRDMPAVISTFEHERVGSLYMLPPVPYPDGKTYIKLGPSGHAEELPAPEHFLDATSDDRELLDWFHTNGRADIAQVMKVALHRMIPGLKTLSQHSAPCLITYSAHGNPYINTLESDRLYIATAGNGSAAKSSDEIGRLGAALCATDEWHSTLDHADFRAVYS